MKKEKEQDNIIKEQIKTLTNLLGIAEDKLLEQTVKNQILSAERDICELKRTKPTGYEIEIEYRESLIARFEAFMASEKGEKKE